MQVSAKGKAFIKSWEGEVLKVYLDAIGLPTGGVGHLLNAAEKRRHKVGTPISKQLSDAWFDEDVLEHAKPVDDLVKVPMTQGQYDALVSLVFNIGAGNFAKSTLLKRLNAGNYKAAHDAFDSWVFAGRKKLLGLIRRRNAEQVLFNS